jgi:hypothetical protein
MRISSLALCFFAIFSAAGAAEPAPASPTDTYIMARDRYIAAFKGLPDEEVNGKRGVDARTEVETLLQLAVPSWSGPDVSRFSAMNRNDCMDDPEMGFSVLDGRVYGAGKASVIVTNRALLMRWLDHRHGVHHDNIPGSIPAAFRADDFWTFSAFCDAAAQLRGQVLVKAPAGTDIAFAALGLFAQYVATDKDADTLLVAVVRGDRVFVAKEKLADAMVRPAICKRDLDLTLAKAAAVQKSYREYLKTVPPGTLKDTTRFGDYLALEKKADREYSACFAQHLREQPNYAAIEMQAQAVVDSLR